MTVVGQWRATYTPGDWLVLCGPTSLVVMEPPGAGWTPLVEELWQQVLAASSMVDLASRLATYGLDTMPSFGALFWSAEGMRSLVRGAVSVVDPSSGRTVASGAGILTWSEVGLDGLSTVRIQISDDRPDGSADALQLPLVVGAVQASAVLLDARAHARVHSPQLDRSPAGERAERTSRAHDAPVPEVHAGDDEPEPRHPAAPPVEPSAEPGPLPTPPAPTGPTVEAAVCPYGHPNPPDSARCRDCGVTVTDHRARLVAQPPLAVLRVSDGTEALLDRTVLVGRAPVARDPGPVRLLTVPSPSHDISRTHLQLSIDGWRVLVEDLYSTNGTLLVDPNRTARRTLPPGKPVVVELGSVLELADGVSVRIDDPR